jgi:RNA polymerase sigma-70 factor (ECF subfamily)
VSALEGDVSVVRLRRAALESLVRAERQDLLAHVRVVYGLDRADDIVNEVFAVAWQRLDDLPDDHRRAWLRTTARNVVRNNARGERRLHAVTERASRLTPLPVEEPPDTDSRLQLTLVLDALATLRQQDRELLLMLALEDLTLEEIAAILGISEAAAKVRVSRARRRLRHAVEQADRLQEAAGPVGSRRR